MQEILKNIQEKFKRATYYISVEDSKNDICLHKKIDSKYLEIYHEGLFTNYLDSLKKLNIENVIIHQRLTNGSSSKPGGSTVNLKLKLPNPTTSFQTETISSQIPVQKKAANNNKGYSAAKAELLEIQLNDAKETISKLEANYTQVQNERDLIRNEKVELNQKLALLERDLEDAIRKKRKAKRKAEEPKGLMGIVPPEYTSTVIENLPQILEATGKLLNPKTTEANKGQEIVINPDQELSLLHQKVINTLREWPESLLKEPDLIIDKYQTGEDPNFIEQIRTLLGLKILTPNKEAASG